jgi:hypothetical protein
VIDPFKPGGSSGDSDRRCSFTLDVIDEMSLFEKEEVLPDGFALFNFLQHFSVREEALPQSGAPG